VKIDRRLNLVIPIEREDEPTIYVHSMPLSREVFERYFLVISKAFSAIYAEGLSIIAGPRIAAMLIRKIAEDAGVLDDVTQGLLMEIKRLTNVMALTPEGWTMTPLQNAEDRGLLDEDEVSEVEGVICFFMLASAMHKKAELRGILEKAASLWGAELSSLSAMEHVKSLPTLTPAAVHGKRVKVSSTTSSPG
jgi:hypothetical protein